MRTKVNIPKISVIVPVYNVANYLSECIDSVLNQIFTDFELLLINDGSSDNSGNICNYYALKDSRIRVFHKENGGVMSARKMGIINAKGYYINFIDSDDNIPVDSLQILYQNMEQDDIDIIVARFSPERDSKVNKIYDGLHLAIDYLHQDPSTGPFAKLFKKKYFDDYVLNIPKEITIREDWIMNTRLALKATKVKRISDIVYNYRTRQDSLSSNMSFYKKPDIFKLWYDLLIDSFVKNGAFENVKSSVLLLKKNDLLYYIPAKSLKNNDWIKVTFIEVKQLMTTIEKTYVYLGINPYTNFISIMLMYLLKVTRKLHKI